MIEEKVMIDLEKLTRSEREEMIKLGILTESGDLNDYKYPDLHVDRPPVPREAVHAPQVIDEAGKPEHIGDFNAQTWRTYRNISNLLKAEDMSWHDVVRTTNYLRDIERDYAEFNKIRTTFFQRLNLDPLPASKGIQAILCCLSN
jgi:hypothetical protein